MSLAYTEFLTFPVLVVYAAASDLLSMKIPNWVSMALVLLFAIAAAVIGLDLGSVLNHVAAGVLAISIGFAMFALGWIGGGDAKLAAAIALWFGLNENLTDFAMRSALAGGALAILLLAYRRIPLPEIALAWRWTKRLHNKQTGIPYGIALAGGALAVYSTSQIGIQLLTPR